MPLQRRRGVLTPKAASISLVPFRLRLGTGFWDLLLVCSADVTRHVWTMQVGGAGPDLTAGHVDDDVLDTVRIGTVDGPAPDGRPWLSGAVEVAEQAARVRAPNCDRPESSLSRGLLEHCAQSVEHRRAS